MKHILFSLFLIANIYSYDHWEPSKYMWGLHIARNVDVGLTGLPKAFLRTESQFDVEALKKIKENDIVWVQGRNLNRFIQEVLPHVTAHFTLVSNHGDDSLTDDCPLLQDERVLHIYAQNCDTQHKKAIPIPIGMDYHTIAYKGRSSWGERASPLAQEAELDKIVSKLKPTGERLCKAFVDFQHADTMRANFKRYLQFGEDRTEIYKKLLPTGLIDSARRMKRSQLWARKGKYAFSISPPGNGIDCHRTWEDLLLGCIVIVKHTNMDRLYDGLPVVIVNDWSEVTKENLQKWQSQFSDALTNPSYREKLTAIYWINKIKSKS